MSSGSLLSPQAMDVVASQGVLPRVSPAPKADLARLERLTVCTRPFRGAGPRVEAEPLDGKLLVHNYGHGGSGWSLSWGTAAETAALALADGPRPVAVVGCGAMGLTTALTLQRAGAAVTIYARELPPAVRSSRATGLWSPDSRVALAGAADARFTARWERLARQSWAAFGQLLGAANQPVALHDRHVLSELPPDEDVALRYREDPIGFAHLDHRLADLYRPPVDRGPGEHGFRTPYCRTLHTLRFNITTLSQHLLTEFHDRGGTLQRRSFHTPAEMVAVSEPVVVNCTGWEAQKLFADTSLTPVRGQIAWLPPEPAVSHSLQWGKLSMVARADGTVVQLGASSDGTGWNDAAETPNNAEAAHAIGMLARLQG